MSAVRTLLLSLVATAPAVGQIPYPVGFQDGAFPNPTATGSASLVARTYYPATLAGANAPLFPPPPGGYPVIVYLHGFGVLGSGYGDLATVWASRGFVAVLLNTAQFQSDLQRDDGIAVYAALAVANQTPGDFFFGALDMQRAGVSGHSMGGGNVYRVLAANPGYATGIPMAPSIGSGGSWINAFGPQIQVPIGIVHGMGDTSLPPPTTSLPWYNATTAYTGLKSIYVLGAACNHINVAILPPSPTLADLEVFVRVASVSVGWFERWLKDAPEGLEEVAGPPALADPNFFFHAIEAEQPDLWNPGPFAVGQTATLRALAQPGVAGIYASTATASIPTPFGTLLVDPTAGFPLALGPVDANQLLSFAAPVPSDNTLVGLPFHFQGFGVDRVGAVRLTPRVDRVIGP